MSKSFQARGEQWQRLAACQEQQRLAALTAYVDGVIGGQALVQPTRQAHPIDAGRLVMLCVLCLAFGALIGVAVMRAIYG